MKVGGFVLTVEAKQEETKFGADPPPLNSRAHLATPALISTRALTIR